MQKIIAILNSKGGVGKSTTSESVCFTLASQGIKFKLIEIDLANESHDMSYSLIFKDNIEQIRDVTDTSILNKLIKANLENEIVTVLDIGSGADTLQAIEQFQKVAFIQIKYIIPLDSSLRNLKNAKQTIDRIGENQDVSFVLNKVFENSKMKEQFLFFFGSKKMKISSFQEKYPNFKFASIPYSNFFELASVDNYSIADMAQISREVSMEDAVTAYQKEYLVDKNDEQEFDRRITNYLKSQDARVVVDATISSLSSILDIDTKSSKVQ